MAELIAAGTTTTAWTDFTVTAGAAKALFIKPASGDGPAPSGVNFEIAHKTSGGNYAVIDVLNAGNIVNKGNVAAAGTYGVRRLASVISAGMDLEG